NFYDEILFNGATFNDLKRDGPRILVGATDLADGTRLIFNPENFDALCTDLSSIRLARAAAASSAVPVVLSSITIDNHGRPLRLPAAALGADFPRQSRSAAACFAHGEALGGAAGLRRQQGSSIHSPGRRRRLRQRRHARRARRAVDVRSVARRGAED